jgi:hypothetical protein
MSPTELPPDASTTTQTPASENPRTEPPKPLKNYFELRLRIRYWWLGLALAVTIVVYPIAFLYTAVQKKSFRAQGPIASIQKQWDETGCSEIIREQSKSDQLDDWLVKRNWLHLLQLDKSHLAYNSQFILNEPLCLGARIGALYQTGGAWRYDIVDNKTQKIIISITKGE